MLGIWGFNLDSNSVRLVFRNEGVSLWIEFVWVGISEKCTAHWSFIIGRKFHDYLRDSFSRTLLRGVCYDTCPNCWFFIHHILLHHHKIKCHSSTIFAHYRGLGSVCWPYHTVNHHWSVTKLSHVSSFTAFSYFIGRDCSKPQSLMCLPASVFTWE